MGYNNKLLSFFFAEEWVFCYPIFHLKAMIHHISGNRNDFLKVFPYIIIHYLSFLSTFPSHITSFNVYYSMFLPTFKAKGCLIAFIWNVGQHAPI
jgi:hypothetical protein